MVTNFPNKGDNKKISLRNSKFRQFDYEFAQDLAEKHPEIWKAGGNDYGNRAFKLWSKLKEGDSSESVQKWIVRRERFLERHVHDKNLPGIVASIKWGGCVEKGKSYMKKLVKDEIKKKEKP